jgi:prepilin-type N-terminal cleavage/methylation domain-containing protein
MFFKTSKSFTLIELLIVIAVIGFISSVVLVSMKGVQKKGRITAGLRFSQNVNNTLGAYAVGIWDFDDNDTPNVANDRSGYGNHGIINGATYTSDTPHKIIGRGEGKYALSFDGNDWVEVPHSSSLDIADAITIEAWVKVNNMPSGHHDGVIQHMDGCATNGYFLCFQGSGLTLVSGSGGVNAGDWSVSGFSPGKWYHIVFIWKSTGVASSYQKFIINGGDKEQQRNIGMPTPSSVASDLLIGRITQCWGNQYFNGIIDEVRIYEHALSAAQIQQHYVQCAERRGITLK